MAYTTGILKDRVTILNRKEAQQGKFGLDSAGIEFETADTVWAEVTWAKGKQALNAGALDVYGVKMIRMRWNTIECVALGHQLDIRHHRPRRQNDAPCPVHECFDTRVIRRTGVLRLPTLREDGR